MKRLIPSLLLAASFGASAADLTYLPAPTLTPADQTTIGNIQANRPGVTVTVTGMNAAALDSTTVNVTIAGQVYSFTGVKTAKADFPNGDVWKGTAGSATAILLRSNGIVRGLINLGEKSYEVIQVNTWVGATVQVPAGPTHDTEITR